MICWVQGRHHLLHEHLRRDFLGVANVVLQAVCRIAGEPFKKLRKPGLYYSQSTTFPLSYTTSLHS